MHKLIKNLQVYKNKATAEGKLLAVIAKDEERYHFPQFTLDLNNIPDVIWKSGRPDPDFPEDPITNFFKCTINTAYYNACPFDKNDFYEKGPLHPDYLDKFITISYSDLEKESEYDPEIWEEVGSIGVDAGLCWIGDPCYILHPVTQPKSIGNSWSDFCNNLDNFTRSLQFNYDHGHEGLGVVVTTGYGDGFYPVLARFTKEGRVKEVKVVFIEEDNE